MAKDREKARKARAFWSGTISFGLVSVPVDLFPANRHGRASLRMLAPDGTPLQRQYYCAEDERVVHPEHILRGYEVAKGEYVIIRDEELEAVEPQKSRDINLQQFVDRSEVPPLLFERSYYLAPAGNSNKAYRLLAHVMENTQRAGIATFVMRSKEYLVAILAEQGILRAETLRFHDEIRSPEQVGLPKKKSRKGISKYERAIKKRIADELNEAEMQDEYTQQLQKLAQAKRRSSKDVVKTKVHTDETDAMDLLEAIRRSMKSTNGRSSTNGPPRKVDRNGGGDLEQQSKEELYERAKQLDIPGRSKMSKQQLVRSIRDSL